MSLRTVWIAGWLAMSGAAWAGPVSLSAADGVELAAASWGSGTRGVLLVHEAGRDHQAWGTFAERLSSAGFHVLALDLRGHGGSKAPPTLTDDDYPKMVGDVAAGVTWLKGHGAESVVVIGAELGANLALNTASDNADIARIALLSPALNAHGVKVSAAISSYGERPLLLVASQGDALSAKAAGLLEGKAAGPTQLELYPGSEAGSRLLNAVPDLENLIVGFLNNPFEGSPGDGMRDEVTTGQVDEVEVRGTRLEERER